MAPAALGAEVASWLVLLALVLTPGIVATILWSPMLASGRLRSLFRQLPPTGSAVGNYVLVAMGLSIPWLAGLVWSFHELGSQGDPQGEVFLNTATLLAVAYLVCLPLGAGLGLPRLGIDWDPTGYGLGTWLLLLLGSAWYAAIFTVPMFLIGIVVSLPF